MTRLTSEDIGPIGSQLATLDEQMHTKCGHGLLAVASRAAGLHEAWVKQAAATQPVGVVPFTCGQGVIGGFSQTVARIAAYLGWPSFVTRTTDVDGIAEATAREAEILFMADDHRFIAVRRTAGRVADNEEATGRGFATVLDLMAGGVQGRPCLVIGCGPVGTHAGAHLIECGGQLALYDSNHSAALHLQVQLERRHGTKVQVLRNLDGIAARYFHIVDACPAADVIDETMVTPQTFVAIPGVPPGLTDGAREIVGLRLHHDPLELGVAVMLCLASGLVDSNC